WPHRLLVFPSDPAGNPWPGDGVLAWTGVEVRREGDGRFVVEGELDVSKAEQLGEVLWADLRAGSSVVVGLSGLAFMDSQGLRLFLRLALHAEQRGLGPVVLVNPSPAVRRILEISLPQGMPGLAVREQRT